MQKRSKIVIAVIVAIVVIGGTVLWTTKYHNKPDTNRPHTPVANSSSNQGGAVDNKGVTPPANKATDTSKPTSSSSGIITLEQPVANAALKSGDIVSGTARVDTIQYRLVDDKAGVLAQGPLSVVDGKFSGTLQFKAFGTTGTLKVFSIDSQSGAEINRIELPIKLSP
jgi:hypothetical protein